MPVILHLPLCLFIISMSGRLCKVYPVMILTSFIMPTDCYVLRTLTILPAIRQSLPQDGISSESALLSLMVYTPENPTIPNISPSSIWKFTSFSAWTKFFFVRKCLISFRLYQKFHLKEKRRTTLTVIRLFYSHPVNVYKIINVILGLWSPGFFPDSRTGFRYNHRFFWLLPSCSDLYYHSSGIHRPACQTRLP